MLFYCITPLKCKSSDAGNSDTPKKSYKVLPLSERVKVLNKERKKKKYAEVAKIWGKDESSISETGKKGKKM